MDTTPGASTPTVPPGSPSSNAPNNPPNEQNNAGPSPTDQTSSSQQGNIISTRGGQISRNVGSLSLFTNYSSASQTWALFNPSLANSSLVSIAGRINVSGKRSRTTVIIFFILVIVLVIALVGAATFSPFVAFILAIILGIFLMYVGYSYLSKHLLLANTPISKIASAPVGFGVFQVRFNPEDEKPLVSPLAKTPCSLYTVALIRTLRMQNTYSSNPRMTNLLMPNNGANPNYVNTTIVQNVLSYFSKGKKSTLYDGTGHLVTDLSSILALGGSYRVYMLYPKLLDSLSHPFGGIPNEIAPIKEAIDRSIQTGQDPDLESALSSVKNAQWSRIGSPDMDKSTQNAGFYLIEYTLPTNIDYTAAGFVDHTDKQLNGKPVSKLTPDPGSKMFLLSPYNQKQVTKKEFNIAILSFAVSLIVILSAYAIGTHNNMYQCLLMVNNSGTYYCHFLNGSFMPLGGSHNSVQAKSNNTIATQSAHPTSPPPVTSIVPTTIPYAATLNQTHCNTVNITTGAFLSQVVQNCTWNGGDISITLGGGNSGWASAKIIASNGTQMYTKGGTYYCPTPLGSIYLPKGNYTVILTTGHGGGNCGNAKLIIQ
ncbi:MAG: hypothetical protein ACP5FR_02240 [Candidatus Micrarchaeia archaeon]